MSNRSHYSQRIIELINLEIENDDIIQIIKQEYSIYLSESQINKRREPAVLKKENDLIETQKYTLISNVKEILKLNNFQPKSAREIAKLLNERYNLKLSRREISKLLYSKPLIDETLHCKITYTYKIKFQNHIETEAINKDKLDISFWWNLIKTSDLLSDLDKYIRKNYFQIDSGNEKYDDAVKNVLRDNIITPTEELFLMEKAKELNVPEEYLSKIKLSIHQNNPYFDNIIHLVFEDNNISIIQMKFIQEKIEEHNFSPTHFNIRFWQIGILNHINYLIKLNNFIEIIILWELFMCVDPSNNMLTDNIFFSALDITKGANIEEVLDKGLEIILDQFCMCHKLHKDTFFKILLNLKSNLNLDKNYIPIENEIFAGKNINIRVLTRIIEEEKIRIGSPASTLLAENILFRIENNI